MNTKNILEEIIKKEVLTILEEWSTSDALDRRFSSYSEAKKMQDQEKKKSKQLKTLLSHYYKRCIMN
jgi:hypothetical protein